MPTRRAQDPGADSVSDRKRAAHNTEHREETKCQLMNQGAPSVQSVGVSLKARSINHIRRRNQRCLKVSHQ